MKIGNLIRYFNPSYRKMPRNSFTQNRGLIGLVIDYDNEAQGSPNIEGRGMVQVLFNGFTLLRWVHEQDCEVLNESR